jgi:acetate kinase
VNILVANVGSTSFKYRLFDVPSERALAEGWVERVGQSGSAFEHRTEGREPVRGKAVIPDYEAAIRRALALLTGPGEAIRGPGDLAAVGFKTVHLRGAPGSYLLTDDVLGRMADYNDLAPAHNPPYIRAIRIFREVAPGVPLVGVFEPAFHATIPDYAYIYGVPYRWYERYGIRKYGFHGASHRYVAERVPQLMGVPAEGLRIVSCHLGGSASVCAIRGGRSIDTSMGFSPQDGILNATRTGSVDPFAVLHAMDREGLSTAQARRALSEEGGLLGISGVSGDVRDLEEAAGRGHDRSRLALEAFCYGVKTSIGAYAAALGGLDVLAFAGGIGEKGVEVRRRICAGLGFIGIALDEAQNRSGAPERLISADGGRIKVFIIRANEEVVVARATAEVITR